MTAPRGSASIGGVIRNAVIHLSNEQPLLADLFGLPTAGDAGLLCTNLRMLDGKRPVFIDAIAATFYFPYLHIRFVEIAPASLARHLAEGGEAPASAAAAAAATASGAGDPAAASLLPVPAGDPEPGELEELDLDGEIEIDEDFLRRVRDI